MNWKVGDRAKVIKANNQEHIGKIVTIISGPTYICKETGKTWTEGCAHYVNIPTLNDRQGYAAFCPDWLVPIDDGREKTTWENCVWKPTNVEA